MTHRKILSLVVAIFFSVGTGCSSNNREGTSDTAGETIEYPYMIGTGIYDITGPPAEVMFAGMVDLSQKGEGMSTSSPGCRRAMKMFTRRILAADCMVAIL